MRRGESLAELADRQQRENAKVRVWAEAYLDARTCQRRGVAPVNHVAEWEEHQQSLRWRPQTEAEAIAEEKSRTEWAQALARSEADAQWWNRELDNIWHGIRAERRRRDEEMARATVFSRDHAPGERELVRRVAAVLRVQANARGLGYRDVERLSGVGYGPLQGILGGTREPTIVELRRIAVALGMTVEEVLATDPAKLAEENLVPHGVVTGRSHGW